MTALWKAAEDHHQKPDAVFQKLAITYIFNAWRDYRKYLNAQKRRHVVYATEADYCRLSPLEPVYNTIEEGVEKSERLRKLDWVWNEARKLKPHHRAVMVEFMKGCTGRDIARRTGLSECSVSNIRTRILRDLKRAASAHKGSR
jgi:DNA-binding NarL/FixJ family response regulator